MQISFLTERTERDIDRRVSKILKDLGDPDPPLRLEVVRELLRLDLAYYSSSDQGVLSETVHRLSVAGKQVFQRPGLLWEAVKKLDLKALWLPDRKRILIDKELPSKKQRWGEAHEIGHSILPWHEAAIHGDMKQTLSPTCEHQIEAEANFTAGGGGPTVGAAWGRADGEAEGGGAVRDRQGAGARAEGIGGPALGW